MDQRTAKPEAKTRERVARIIKQRKAGYSNREISAMEGIGVRAIQHLISTHVSKSLRRSWEHENAPIKKMKQVASLAKQGKTTNEIAAETKLEPRQIARIRCSDAKTLEDLKIQMIEGFGFGGDPPEHMDGVWAWDHVSVLVGDSPETIRIDDRHSWKRYNQRKK